MLETNATLFGIKCLYKKKLDTAVMFITAEECSWLHGNKTSNWPQSGTVTIVKHACTTWKWGLRSQT